MLKIRMGLILGFLVFLFFCLMARIDFIVHGILYHYGLQFSYEWALDYWVTYILVFIVFSITVAFIYWFGSNKTRKDLRFSVALFVTINSLLVGGFQDILFYVFWAGGLPPIDVVWWWIPWTHIVGTWTSLHQIGFAAIMGCGVLLTWVLATKK